MKEMHREWDREWERERMKERDRSREIVWKREIDGSMMSCARKIMIEWNWFESPLTVCILYIKVSQNSNLKCVRLITILFNFLTKKKYKWFYLEDKSSM